jgi:hypothetical protein
MENMTAEELLAAYAADERNFSEADLSRADLSDTDLSYAGQIQPSETSVSVRFVILPSNNNIKSTQL